MSNEVHGKCTTCGRNVIGKETFIGGMQFHCDEIEPFGCMPKSWERIKNFIYESKQELELKNEIQKETSCN